MATQSVTTPRVKRLAAVCEAFAKAEGKWSGVDWRTDFGQSGLDLEGLDDGQELRRWSVSIDQGHDVGDGCPEPTSGLNESLPLGWRGQWVRDLVDAADWVDEVATSAAAAESAAQEAVEAFAARDFGVASDLARRASDLERQFGTDRVWGAFRRAIEGGAE